MAGFLLATGRTRCVGLNFRKKHGVETGGMVVTNLNQQQRPGGPRPVRKNWLFFGNGDPRPVRKNWLSLWKWQDQGFKEKTDCKAVGHLREWPHRNGGWQERTGKWQKAQRNSSAKLQHL